MKLIKGLFWTLLAVFSLFFILIALWISFYPAKYTTNKICGAGVVFGAGITVNSEPSDALKCRLDKSLELYKNGKILKFVVSGRMPETVVMRNYLNRNMISPDLIESDYLGKNTYSTVLHARDYQISRLSNNSTIAFISQRYHLPRIAFLAWRLSLSNCVFVASEPKSVDAGENFMNSARESLALMKAVFLDGSQP